VTYYQCIDRVAYFSRLAMSLMLCLCFWDVCLILQRRLNLVLHVLLNCQLSFVIMFFHQLPRQGNWTCSVTFISKLPRTAPSQMFKSGYAGFCATSPRYSRRYFFSQNDDMLNVDFARFGNSLSYYLRILTPSCVCITEHV